MTGMLWSDFSKQPLAAKIEQAAAYYRDKYHVDATVALVSKQDLDAAPLGVVGVVVVADAYVSPNYMIVGRMT
jgi:hypothetical protein